MRKDYIYLPITGDVFHETNNPNGKYRTAPTLGTVARLKVGWDIHKTYPTCNNCKERYVPIKDYKKCFKCTFLYA